MSKAEDLAHWQSSPTWFDGETTDSAGTSLRMYSVLTPTETVTQYFAEDEDPIVINHGCRLLVIGLANGDPSRLWLEVNSAGYSPPANLCLPTSQVQFVSMLGEEDALVKGQV